MSFADALRRVTDLGLLPGYNCGVGIGYGRQDGTWAQGTEPWQPQVSADDFARSHTLYALPGSESVGAPSNWSAILAADPEISRVQRLEPIYPSESATTPDASRPRQQCPPPVAAADVTPQTDPVLTAGQAGTLARIQFAAPLDSYDAALYAVTRLGLALAAPCYLARSQQSGGPPTWRSMGQEAGFARTHSLTVFTMHGLTSAQWQAHLRATSGATAITLLQPSCAS